MRITNDPNFDFRDFYGLSPAPEPPPSRWKRLLIRATLLLRKLFR